MDDFAKIAVTADLPPNGLLLIEVEDERIVLANVDGQYYVVTDLCTHAECPLSDGDLDGEVLKCPCHGGQFDVRARAVVGPLANEPLTLYAVRVEGDDILVGPRG